MPKFLFGILVGAALAFAYVRWGIELPKLLGMPDKLRGNLISTATESDLYSLDQPIENRRRALEVLFANRPEFAASVDAESGHPFLEALYTRRAIREAGALRQEWEALDVTLSKPSLREALEKKHGVRETLLLKQRILLSSLEKYPFLKQWIERSHPNLDEHTLPSILDDISARPRTTGLAAPQ